MSNEERISSLWMLLKIAFGVLFLVAGFDKFFDLLVDWSKYLAPSIADMILSLGISVETFMKIGGVVEIITGIIILSKATRAGAYIAATWLVLIAINLIMAGYYDIAVRDIMMALGAYSLAQLTHLQPGYGKQVKTIRA